MPYNYHKLTINRPFPHSIKQWGALISARIFETQMVPGSEVFSLLTCPHTTTFTLLSIYSPLEMSSTKI